MAVCDGYPGVGLPPRPRPPPPHSLAVASELTPDTGLSSRGTAQASAPNECRVGLLLLLLLLAFARM